jgi:hypothetical protein
LERLFFAKIEAWIVFLIIVALLLGSILFAYIAQERAKGSDIGDGFGRHLYELAKSPDILKRALEEVGETKGGRIRELDPGIGVNINSFTGLDNVPGYMGARTDGKTKKTYVLRKISTGETELEWPYHAGLVPAAVSFMDQTLIVKDAGGFEEATEFLRKIDHTGNQIWSRRIAAHHSIYVDRDGYIYTPIIMQEHANTRFVENYRDDGYAILSPDGEIVETGSVTEILVGNDLGHLIYGVGPIEWDAIHLNAIKPAESTTRYWNKGDLLMSSRHLSTIFLYRPDTGKVIWHQTGPWLNQHDPDFLGSNRISVFGNDVVSAFNNRTSKEAQFLGDGNDIYVYDFLTKSVRTPYTEMIRSTGLSTITGGSHTILTDGSVFIYFTNAGVGAMYNAEKTSLHYFGVISSQNKVSIGAAPVVYESDQVQ